MGRAWQRTSSFAAPNIRSHNHSDFFILILRPHASRGKQKQRSRQQGIVPQENPRVDLPFEGTAALFRVQKSVHSEVRKRASTPYALCSEDQVGKSGVEARSPLFSRSRFTQRAHSRPNLFSYLRTTVSPEILRSTGSVVGNSETFFRPRVVWVLWPAVRDSCGGVAERMGKCPTLLKNLCSRRLTVLAWTPPSSVFNARESHTLFPS